jgi:hypothetical protein
MNRLKKITVWLLATSLVLAGAAMLIPKQAVASVAAQVFMANHSVPTSNPLPTRDVDAQTVLVFDQTLTVNQGTSTTFGPVDVSMFKQVRAWASVDGTGVLVIETVLQDPSSVLHRVTLDTINASGGASVTKTYDILWPNMSLIVTGHEGANAVHVLIYGRTN